MELTGFEPAAPSLRKMRSKPSDQGKRHPVGEDVDECPVRTGYVGGDLVDLLRFEQQLLSDIAWEA